MLILNTIFIISLFVGLCQPAFGQYPKINDSQNISQNANKQKLNKYIDYKNRNQYNVQQTKPQLDVQQARLPEQMQPQMKQQANPQIQKPENSSYQKFLNEQSVYGKQEAPQNFDKNKPFNNKQDPASALMPQKDIQQFQNYQQPQESFSNRSKKVISNIANGFNFNVYTQIGAGSGKYDYSIQNGWNVVSISPDLTGSYDSNFSTSSNVQNSYQNISSSQSLNSKLAFGNVGIFAKLEFPSIVGENDLKILKPFIAFDLNYSTAKPLEIKAQKEIGHTNTLFQYVTVDYKYEGLKYTNMVSLGTYVIGGLYGSYGTDIYTKKKRAEIGYDFGGIILFIAQEKLSFTATANSKISTNPDYQLLPTIQYNSIMAGLRFRVI